MLNTIGKLHCSVMTKKSDEEKRCEKIAQCDFYFHWKRDFSSSHKFYSYSWASDYADWDKWAEVNWFSSLLFTFIVVMFIKDHEKMLMNVIMFITFNPCLSEASGWFFFWCFCLFCWSLHDCHHRKISLQILSQIIFKSQKF